MAQPFQVYLFGDQTYDVSAGLHALLHDHKSPTLSSFFKQAFCVLRAEVGALPFAQRETFPRFASVAELLAKKSTHRNPATENSLTLIYQLGYFIGKHDSNERPYPRSGEVCVSGLCTGALSAAAISCCKSLSELLPVAVQTVLVAFRTGLCAWKLRDHIDASDGEWSMIVPSPSPNTLVEALKKFAENQLPPTSELYISAHALHGLTISAPPSTLAGFCNSDAFAGFRSKRIPIFAPYHAPHLYSRTDVEWILETTVAKVWAPYKACLAMISSTTGDLIKGDDLRSRLESALEQVLIQPIQWDQLGQGVATMLSSSRAQTFTVIPFGTSAEESLYTALKQIERASASSTGLPLRSDGSFQHGPATVPHQELEGSNPENSKIAIIGMSGRFPTAESNEDFWKLLHEGLDVHKVVPTFHHWDAKTHVDLDGKIKNTSATPYGCWLESPAAFDARFFNMSPREAPQVDPAQRIALMTAFEAIEQAGIVPDATPSTQKERVGVFYGVTSNDWMETNSAQQIDTYFIPGGNRAFIPGRLNYFFKFSGPSYSVDTACSSSLAAIHVACNSLWQGDIDTAIAGGTNVLTNPDFTAGLDRGHFLSRTGNCKTFDDDADGYCRGEGVGTVILKRLEDALADKDPIQGLILGAYTNHSAEAQSITRPHIPAQRAIFDKILNKSGIDPYSISYVEMHGTGTQAGDAGEMSSVLETFAPATRKHRRDDQALYLGSAKANIGHGEAASGITSLAKVLLMMQKSVIPPHCGIKTKINHKFPTDLATRNVRITKTPLPWIRQDGKVRRVFLNNFSAAGGNTALLLEDAPLVVAKVGNDPRTSHMVAVSAKCAASLTGNLKSMLAYIAASGEVEATEPILPKLSYTTTARRIHNIHRVMVAGSSIQEIKTNLEAAIARGDGMTRPKSAPKIVFTFTGQGSQYIGMGKQLYSSLENFRSNIGRLSRLGQSLGFPSLTPVFEASSDGDIQQYGAVVSQLAMVCLQIALSSLWANWGITPDAVMGHSLGGYAALNVSGVLSEAHTLYLVGKRGQLLEERCTRDTHSMLVVKAPLSEIEALLEGADYEVACHNSPNETVLAGTHVHLGALQKVVEQSGLKTKILSVPFAFHSKQIEPILDDFEDAARGVVFNKPVVPVLSTLMGEVVTGAGIFGPGHVRRHSREPVNFIGALNAAKESRLIDEKTFFVEIGPHPITNGLIKATLGTSVRLLSTLQRNKDDWKVVTDSLSSLYCAGKDILWTEYHREFEMSHEVLQLPAYSWDLKDYWIQYVNDWSLRKGDPPLIAAAAAPLESTTIHKVLQDDGITLVVESDIGREDLKPLVKGHAVDGVPLCTPSVYADIALTLGSHILNRYHPEDKDLLVDISNMTIQKALIAKVNGGPQPIRTFMKVDWTTKSAKCRFVSLDNNGEATIEHSNCIIQFTDRSQVEVLKRSAQQTLSRISNMRKGLESGKTQRFNRTMVYKMISPLAKFDENYKAIDEVIIDSNTFEATSRVHFRDVKVKGNFHEHPAFIDGLTQSGGFVMNCNDGNDLDVEVFVNHGWKSFQLFEKLSAEKSYTTFVQMFEKEGKMWEGDVTAYDGDRVVASFRGIVLQGVPRRVLHYVLSVEGDRKPNIRKISNNPSTRAIVPALVSNALPIATKQPEVSVAALPTTALAKIEDVLHIISEESGVAMTDLTDDCVFADMGVDSLLSLVIVSRLGEELGLEMDLESMFTEYPTVKHLKEFLEPASSDVTRSPSSGSDSGDRELHGASTLVSSASSDLEEDVKPDSKRMPVPAATSVVLQNRITDSLKTLFLFPDGAGSATSYSGLPKIDAKVAVVGLNSPYYKNPADFVCSVDDLIVSYVNEVRRRQPEGPYNFGGWSAGGILAYRAAQELISSGQEVESLLLIDSPFPKGLDRLPKHFYDFCNKVHLFGKTTGSTKPPEWLIPHFNATIDTLHEYYADPLPKGQTPKVLIVWACNSVMDGKDVPKMAPHPDDTEGMKFLTEPRTDFSGNGWQDLFPGGDIVIERMVGTNHFTMTRGEHASKLTRLISDSLLEL